MFSTLSRMFTIMLVAVFLALGAGAAFAASQEVAGSTTATLDLYVNSADPTTTPSLGQVRFFGNEAGPTTHTLYVSITGTVDDATTDTQDATLRLYTMVDGTLTTVTEINAAGFKIIGDLEVTGTTALADTLTIGSGATAYGLPTSDGTASQVLKTDGSGTVSWGTIVGTESDTLGSVCARGATTTETISAGEYEIGDDRAIALEGTSNRSVFIGKSSGAYTAGDYQTGIGYMALFESTSTSNYVTAIGAQAGQDSSGANSTFVGHRAGIDNSGSYSSAVGVDIANGNSASCLSAIGNEAAQDNTGTYLTAIGFRSGRYNTGYSVTALGAAAGASNTHDYVMLLGYSADATASRQVVVGGDHYNGYLTDGYFGRGVVSSLPPDFTIHATGGNGTNIAGADLVLAGGQGTGDAAAGQVIVQTASTGTSGTTLNSLVDRLTIDASGAELAGVLTLDATSEPTTPTAAGCIWAETISGTTEIRVQNSAGVKTTISPHRFDLYEPSLSDPAPWSYYSEDPLIGKRVNVDMSGAILALEEITGRQFLYTEDLPPAQRRDWREWQADLDASLIAQAEERELARNPWIEITPEEAIEEVEETYTEETVRTVTRYRLNVETVRIEAFEAEEDVTEEVPTGRTIKRIKEDVRVDPVTGRIFRRRTLDDVTLAPEMIPAVIVPQYILDRVAP